MLSVNEIIEYLSFSGSLVSHCIMFPRPIDTFINISFIFVTEYIPLNVLLNVHLSICLWHLSSFHFQLSWTTLLWTCEYKYLIPCFKFFWIYLEMKLLGHRVIWLYWRTAKPFSTALASSYIPTNGAQGFQYPLRWHLFSVVLIGAMGAWKVAQLLSVLSEDSSSVPSTITYNSGFRRSDISSLQGHLPSCIHSHT